MTHIHTKLADKGQGCLSPSQLASQSILELQRRLRSPIQFKLFSRTDWMASSLNLSQTERALLHWLVYFGLKKDETEVTFVTQKRLAQLTQLSTKTVARFIQKAETLGLIKKYPQAIRCRDGQTVFGPMQNQFTSHAHKLLTADSLENVEVDPAGPLHVTEIRVVEAKEAPDDVTLMPEALQELQWLCDLVGNKYLVFKMMKLAAPHLRSRRCRGLDELLQSHKKALLDGEIENPAAYLLTRLMARNFADYRTGMLNDRQVDQQKLVGRRQEEAREARAKIVEYAKKRLAELSQDKDSLELMDLQTGRKVRYSRALDQALTEKRAGQWIDMDTEELLIKLGTAKLVAVRPTIATESNTVLINPTQHSAEQMNTVHCNPLPVRQNNAEMSVIQFVLPKFSESKGRGPVTGQRLDSAGEPDQSPRKDFINSTTQKPETNAADSSSMKAIQAMRMLLKTRRLHLPQQDRPVENSLEECPKELQTSNQK